MVASDYVDSYYAQTATPGEARPSLEGDVETEVCIVGGGLAGLSTALGLAERGMAVSLVEARQVGWGASGRNGGFVGPGFSLGVDRLISKLGLAQARRLYQLSREGVDIVRERIERYQIDCGPVVGGGLKLSCFDDQEALLREQAFMAECFDEESEYWPPEQLRESLLTDRYHGALYRPNSFQFHPLNYCRGIAKACEGQGVRIFESSPVVRLELGGGEKIITTANGQVRASQAVITCGGYLGTLNRRLSAAIVPVATYVIATEPLGEERIETAIRVPYSLSDTRLANDYYRRLPDTRILWGGRISVRRSKPPDLAGLMRRDLVRIYPQLEGIRVESAWHGLMSYPTHRMPQIGELHPGVWYAMGFGGHGMNTAPMAGELVSTAIAEGDERYRAFAPFGLTPTGGPIGAAAAQLTYWYYQLRDHLRA